MSHTPGPWKVELAAGLPRITSGARVIADLHIQEGIGALQGGKNTELRDEIAANARLISAAPDLLAALKECRAHGFYSVEHLVDAAIEKAEGKQ